MVNCLVSETEPNYSIYLTNEKELNVVSATSEEEIIKNYMDFFPDVFIIDMDNKNLDVLSVIEKIPHLSDSYSNNIIILYSDSKLLSNIPTYRVSMCIPKNQIFQLLLNSIFIVTNKKNKVWYDTDSLHQRVYNLQHKMNLPDNTTGVSYLRKAVRVCYREPKNADNLSTIYKIVTDEIIKQANAGSSKLDDKLIQKYDYKKIQWDIEKTVKSYQNDFKKNEKIIHSLFGDDFSEYDITPKKLIHAMVKYLRINVNCN